MTSADYRPTSGKAEMHLTYKCDLICVNCNRASFLRKPHTPDMTVEDAVEFFRQARELNFSPDILLIGGEPTIHPQFHEIARLAAEFNGGRVQFWSNGYRPETRAALERARDAGYGGIVGETHKPEGSQNLSIDDIFVSPKDFGYERNPCWQHASVICGISVDHEGYSPCAIGGAIDGSLRSGIRTKVLADLFDPEKVAEMTRKLCEHCGHQLSSIGIRDIPLSKWREHVEGCETRFGAKMSPTWIEAMQGRR